MYCISEAYGYDHDTFGIDALDDIDLAGRERFLRAEIGLLARLLARFEDFCDRIDLEALGEATLDDMNDRACWIDWRRDQITGEHDAVTCELKGRREAAARPTSAGGIADNPNWFWNF